MVQGFLVRVFEFVFGFVRRIVICRGVQLQDGGMNFRLCDEGYTTSLDGISLGLLVCQVSFVLRDGMRGSRILDGSRQVLTRICGCSGVRP